VRSNLFKNGEKAHSRFRGQAVVEFALAIPILLMLVFGIIEFARILQAWLALENGARFGLRYAITGNYDPQFCQFAAIALSGLYTPREAMGDDYYPDTGTIDFVAADMAADGTFNCRVSEDFVNGTSWHRVFKTNEEMAHLNDLLIDWARLPSIRDSAIQGAMGLSWDHTDGVSGDYLAFLINAFTIDDF